MRKTQQYDVVAHKLRQFFQEEKGFVEVPAFSRLSIMAACEDPRTVTTYTLNGQVWPLPQTGQMWLEFELLKNPNLPGVFCLGPSYRDEPEETFVVGRHQRIFPMFEFEGKGDIAALRNLESDLLVHLGFQKPMSVHYEDVCAEYGTDEIEHEEEQRMCKEKSPAILLEKFPTRSHPFWNMKYAGAGIFEKIDVLLYGMETIGSAERSCNPVEMREFFFTVSDGEYAQLLFDKFGKERVMKELEHYFSLNYFPRFGGGIGVTRLAHAFEQAGLFDAQDAYVPTFQFGTLQASM